MESNPDNLTGLAVLLADEVLHLTRVDKEIISLYPKIIEGLRAAFSYVSKKFEELDDRLDTHHREFQKDLKTSTSEWSEKRGFFKIIYKIWPTPKNTIFLVVG